MVIAAAWHFGSLVEFEKSTKKVILCIHQQLSFARLQQRRSNQNASTAETKIKQSKSILKLEFSWWLSH
jgi:hypothetical protein